MLDKLFWSFVSGTIFYFGWKVGEAVYPHIRDAVKEGWDEAQNDEKAEVK
jgi:hypothetical protein